MRRTAEKNAEARYAVLRPIAAGGMGTVFLGQREGLGGFVRKVALKRAHAALATKASVQRRFFREAAAASMLHHANVVPVVDLFERDGETWLVLDWIDGLSLSQLLVDRGKLPTAVAVRIVLDACRGLAAAHELRVDDAPLGLQHRDVSPGNVLVGRDGISRLSDFGLSRTLETTITNTEERFLEGKLGYLAPELFQGKDFDVRCDLYAMGVCLWEAAAGMRLFRAQSVTKLMSEQRARTNLATLYPDLAWLERALEGALAYDPSQRCSTVREFSDTLERAAKDAGMLGTTDDVARLMAEISDDAGPATVDGASVPTPVASSRAALAALTPLTGPMLAVRSESEGGPSTARPLEPSSVTQESAAVSEPTLPPISQPPIGLSPARDPEAQSPARALAPPPVQPAANSLRPRRAVPGLALGAAGLLAVAAGSIALIAGSREAPTAALAASASVTADEPSPTTRPEALPRGPTTSSAAPTSVGAISAVIVLGPDDLDPPAPSTASSPAPAVAPRPRVPTEPAPGGVPKNPYRKRP